MQEKTERKSQLDVACFVGVTASGFTSAGFGRAFDGFFGPAWPGVRRLARSEDRMVSANDLVFAVRLAAGERARDAGHSVPLHNTASG